MRSNFVFEKLNYVGLLKRKILYKPFIKLFCPQTQEYAHSYTQIIEKIYSDFVEELTIYPHK